MTTLQEYLNDTYSTKQLKENIKKISTLEINQAREQQGIAELLEGGELDLREYTNIEEVIVDQTSLKTPLTKIDTEDLTHLKEISWNSEPSKPIESEEDKKLWTELGISEETSENTSKKQVIKEIKRLSELFNQTSEQKANIHFATQKAPQEILKDKQSLTEEKDGQFNIYLNLERLDKQGNFNPNLLFWTLTWELASFKFPKYGQEFLFWKNFEEQLNWLKENISENYQKDFQILLTPATFPHERLEMKDLLTIYFPNLELGEGFANINFAVNKEIIDETWSIISQKILELVSEELAKNPTEEQLTQLGIKLAIESVADEYTIFAHYHSQSPFIRQIEELVFATPLKLELEKLKKKQEQLPTPENFDKLTKQKQELENFLQDYTDEETYQSILNKINQIN